MTGTVLEPSPRQELALELWQLADLIQAAETRRSFRARAYREALWSLDRLAPDLGDPVESMLALPGIGRGVARVVEEFTESGAIAELERLRETYPTDSARLRALPRMTPAILRDLKSDVGVDTMVDLERAIETGDALTVRGVGDVTAARWLDVLGLWPDQPAVPAHQAYVLSTAIRAHLARILQTRVEPAGEVRRVTEWVDRLVVAVETDDVRDAVATVGGSVIGLPKSVDFGGRVEMLTPIGLPLDVHIAPPDRFGSAWIIATGPPGPGVDRVAGVVASEEAVAYRELGVAWVPPPAREGDLAVPADLIAPSAIRGDLHLHSLASPDGRMTLEEMAGRLEGLGYEYAVITDHTSGLRFGGLDREGLLAQRRELDAVQASHPGIRILHGAEVNIDPEGGLDVDDATLRTLDLVVAGAHSAFDLPVAEQTDRLIAAIRHPSVRVIAHPHGRRIGIRPGVDLDLERVVAAARESGVALESNGHRDRLDLSSETAAFAAAEGVMVAANSDAHRPGELGNVGNAVATLQRARIRRGQVVNAMSAAEFAAWAGRRT